MIKRVVFALGLALVAGIALVAIVSANGGPHGDYNGSELTDKCAACHRVHQGLSEGKLLKATNPYLLCMTCHNGAGSVLDVADGVKLAATNEGPGYWTGPAPSPATTTAWPGLNGGGFNYINGTTVTSKHNVDPVVDNISRPWGYAGWGQGNYAATPMDGLANSGAKLYDLRDADGGSVVPLQCVRCHNPHGSDNYRILLNKINGNTVNVKVYGTNFGGSGQNYSKQEYNARGLEGGAANTDKYTREYYASKFPSTSTANAVPLTYGVDTSSNMIIASLCGACHTAYPSNDARTALSAPVDGGPSTLHYRHRTEVDISAWGSTSSTKYGFTMSNPELAPIVAGTTLRLASNDSGATDSIVTCLTCHRVHGTTAKMTGYSVANTLTGTDGVTGRSPDTITPSQTSESKSTLLYLDNRGVCQACHQWPY